MQYYSWSQDSELITQRLDKGLLKRIAKDVLVSCLLLPYLDFFGQLFNDSFQLLEKGK